MKHLKFLFIFSITSILFLNFSLFAKELPTKAINDNVTENIPSSNPVQAQAPAATESIATESSRLINDFNFTQLPQTGKKTPSIALLNVLLTLIISVILLKNKFNLKKLSL
ncbi:MAG: hypothetical protein IJC97_01705 [Oscillospiraceae bacterium]|nr:hypothetical protein [Oscillospiraceae bacterium]